MEGANFIHILYMFYLKSATTEWQTMTGYQLMCFVTVSELDYIGGEFLTSVNPLLADFYNDYYLLKYSLQFRQK